jgi:hypothetical protein
MKPKTYDHMFCQADPVRTGWKATGGGLVRYAWKDGEDCLVITTRNGTQRVARAHVQALMDFLQAFLADSTLLEQQAQLTSSANHKEP